MAVVGAPGNDDHGLDAGAAFVFEKPAGGWTNMTQTAILSSSDIDTLDYFGKSVGISGNWIVVGTHFDDENGENSGSAYVFEKPAGSWINMTETRKLVPSDGADFDNFGESVSISGDLVVVGARFDDDNGNNSGSAYLFKCSIWQERK